MEKDFSRFFETVNASVFFEKCNAYFGVSGNVTLNKSFYVFGLKLENRHYIRNKEYFDFQLPCANVLRDQWDVDTFDLVYSGADDTGFYDFGDIPDWEYPLRRGIDLKRPLWGTYFNMGRTQGMLNSNQITPERYNALIDVIPIGMLFEIYADLKDLFDYFDEKGYQLDVKKDSLEYGCYIRKIG